MHRKLAEAGGLELDSSKALALLRSALDSEATGVAILQPIDDGDDFLYVYVNQQYQALKPFRRMEGQSYSAVWPEITSLVMPSLRDVLHEGAVWVEENRRLEVEVAEGVCEERYYTFEVSRLEVGDSRYLVANVSEDTSEVAVRHELRRTQQALEEFIGRVTDAVFSLDEEWRFTLVTKQAESLLRRTAGELLGKTLWEGFPEVAGSRFESEYRTAVREQRPVAFREYFPPLDTWFDVRAYPSPTGLSVFFVNANEAVRAEHERELERERLQTLIDTLPVAVFISDASGGLVYTNEQASAIWGGIAPAHSSDDYGAYKGWRAETGERLRAEDWSGARALRGETVMGEVIDIERFDGRPATILNSSAPIRDAAGTIIGQVTVEQDVTARKEAEDELRFSSAMLASVSDSVFVYPFDGPEAGRLIYVNRAAFESRGFSLREMLGRPVTDFVMSPTRERLPGYLEELGRRGEVEFESLHVRKDGSTFPTEVRLRLVNYGGRRVVLNLSRDITARKAAQKERDRLFDDLQAERGRLRAVLDNMAEGVGLWKPDGTLLDANDTYARILGYGTKAEMGRSLADYADVELQTADGRPVPAEHWPVLRLLRGESFSDVVHRVHIPATGARFVGSYSGSPIRNEDGAVVLGVLTLHDVTDVHQAQMLLQQELDMTSMWLRAADALSSLELDDVLRVLVEVAVDVTGVERAMVLIRDDASDDVTVAYSRGERAAVPGTRYGPRDVSAAYHEAVTSGRIQCVDVEKTAVAEESGIPRERLGYRYYAIVPLRAGAAYVGALLLDDPGERHDFTDRQVAFLEGLAPEAAVAIQNALLHQGERERARLAAALGRIDQSVHSSLRVEEVVLGALKEGALAVGAQSAAIDGIEHDEWVVWYDWGFDESIVGHRYTNEQNPHGVAAAQSGNTIAIDDAFTDPRVDNETMKAYGLRSAVVAPLIVRGKAIACLYYNYHHEPHRFTPAEVDFVAKVASSLSLAIENARLYSAERDIADRLQEALLALPDKIVGVDFAHSYHSATETARVGGDFYDLFELEHGLLGITVGDVAGKGLDAAVLTSLVKNTIRAHATEKGNVPGRILQATNEVVFRATSPESFVTVFFGVLDLKTGVLTYANAGHTAGMAVRTDGRVRQLPATASIIGAFPITVEQEQTLLEVDETLLLYTDGLVEARRGEDFFGEERLMELLNRVGDGDPAQTVQSAVTAVLRFTGGELSDDLAILGLKRLPPSGDRPADSHQIEI